MRRYCVVLCVLTAVMSPPPARAFVGISRKVVLRQGPVRAELRPQMHVGVFYKGIEIVRWSRIKVVAKGWKKEFVDTGGANTPGPRIEPTFEETDGLQKASATLNLPDAGYRGTYQVTLDQQGTVGIDLIQQREGDQELQVAYWAAIIPSEIVAGRPFTVHDAKGGRVHFMPLTPRPHEKRFILNVSRVTFHSPAGDLTFEAAGDMKVFSLVDTRRSSLARTDRLRGLLLYRQPVVSQKPMRMGMRITLSEPASRPAVSDDVMRELEVVEDRPRPPSATRERPLLIPRPKSCVWGNGHFPIREDLSLRHSSRLTGNEKGMVRVATGPLGQPIRVREDASLPNHSLCLGAGSIPDAVTEPGGYSLDVSAEGVHLVASDADGFRSGLATLVQLLDQSKEGRVPRVTIRDHPDFGFRGFHVRVPGRKRLALYRKLIPLLARYKYNALCMQFQGTIELKSRPDTVRADIAMTRDEVSGLVRLAKRHGLEVIPETKSWGHANWLWQNKNPHWKNWRKKPALAALFEPDGWTFCTRNPAIYDVLFPVYDEMLAVFDYPRYCHISLDEAWSHATCPKCKTQDAGLLAARHITKLRDYLKRKGVTAMMWGDMFLPAGHWKGYSSCNGKPPHNCHVAVDRLPKDVIVTDWHYAAHEAFPSLDYFHKHGFKTIAAPAVYHHGNLVNFAREAKKAGSLGMLVTTWFRTPNHPGSIVVGAENAWNAGTPVADMGYDPADETLAHLQDFPTPAAGSRVIPLDLAKWHNCPLRDDVAGDGGGWLDFGPAFDMRSMPQGNVQLLGVPFSIAPSAVMLYAPLPPARQCPKRIDITIGRKITAAYFLHTLGWATPNTGPPLTYRLRYADGAEVSIPIRNRSDIQPWPAWNVNYFEPSSPCLRVAVAWRGRTQHGLPVLVVACRLENPHPDKPVAGLSMISAGTPATPIVLGATIEAAP